MGVSNDPQLPPDGLELTRRQLDVVLAIDRLRDTAPEPSTLLTSIVKLLADKFQADFCLLCLLDRETRELELKSVSERRGHMSRASPEAVRSLAWQVLEAGDVVIWQENDLPPAWHALAVEDTESAMFALPYESHEASAQALGSGQLAGVPVCLGEERLGVLLLARSEAPFTQGDVVLLKAAESQIDSAVMQTYAHYELEQRNLELETIYRVDRIRDQNLSFDDMLNAVLHELCTVIKAAMGFVMLYDRTGQRLELRASTHDNLFRVAPTFDIIDQAANEALQRARLVCYNELGGALHSLMCIPLILRDEIIGVLGVTDGDGGRGFNSEDCRLLTAIASQMDTAIFESLERVRLRRVLGRAVDQRVMERILANPDVDFLKGERSVLTVLYADIRGSTRLAERTDPELLVGFINDYLSRMTEVILSNQGTLDKFVGDEVMALFGAPFPQPDHALRAVRVGLEMQRAHQGVMESWNARGVEAAPIGVGIATGELIVGEMGSAQRSDYTVIGRAANLGARICAVAQAGQVLASQATYDLVMSRVEATSIHGLALKGVGGQVTVYDVTRILD